MLTENDIERISQKIATTYAPLAIGTFGSYAIGSARYQSDLDLFVIKRTGQRPEATVLGVRRLLLGVFHPMDIRVFTALEFEETVYNYLSFTWIVARQARLYHWTAEAAHAVPSLQARCTQTYDAVAATAMCLHCSVVPTKCWPILPVPAYNSSFVRDSSGESDK